ncbi:MAG: sporulation protein YqfD [Bacilli bacterium]|nr:sporulation protein YqfD [Bacilli bacterium]
MNSNFFLGFKNYVCLRITGKNIFGFLKTLNKKKINLIAIEYPKRNEVIIKVSEEDYEKLKKLKTIYKFQEVALYGQWQIKKLWRVHKVFIIMVLLGYVILFLLSNIIFDLEIIHTNSNIRNLIKTALADEGIKRLTVRKKFRHLQVIKAKILQNNRDVIEWLEIVPLGTKYIIKVEERKLNKREEEYNYQHIVAKKKGIIKSIEASSGEIVRYINEYVAPGDILISGSFKQDDEVITNVRAEGRVFAEVWYKVRVEYPLIYQDKYLTGKRKKVVVVNFMRYHWPFLVFHPFTNKEVIKKIMVAHPFLPFNLSYEHHQEMIVSEGSYSYEEALIKATQLATKKIEASLETGEKIIKRKSLKTRVENSKIIVEIFFSVYEDIGISKMFIPKEN